ncbi:group III truncated hemoglobin [Deinococcus arcticus]|uniref:Globin n=1 Tax=Deinococcus arcticus TaxID=2136176 RepID=A0A2T3W8P8_9DEIO|nr:group III truncated hemoglobin [Deinococcus arcticus]PTA68197.1 globin [Deinococcus arcticus]
MTGEGEAKVGLLTTTARPDWPGTEPATPAALPGARALLLPHDGLPVADVQGQPARWAALNLVGGALRRGVPVLGWGTGAALLGRALGAAVTAADPDWSAAPRGAQVLAWAGSVPLHWTLDRAVAWAEPELSPAVRAAFLAALPRWTSRTPGSPLEEVGGEAAVRAVVAEFYARAQADPLLGPVFAAHVHDWPAHLGRVTAFWVTVLGGPSEGGPASTGPPWRGNLNVAHAGLGVRGEHLTRWLGLWTATAHDLLPEPAAEVMAARAQAMGARLGPRPGSRGTSGRPAP